MPRRSVPGAKYARAVKLAEAKAEAAAKEASWRAARDHDAKLDAEEAAAKLTEQCGSGGPTD